MLNSFQRWAVEVATPIGFKVTMKGNWVELTKDGETIECMSVVGVQAACLDAQADDLADVAYNQMQKSEEANAVFDQAQALRRAASELVP